MNKVRNFRTPASIHNFFKLRGQKMSKVFKEALNTKIVVEKSVLSEYYAGMETPVRLTDEQFEDIKNRAEEMDLAHTIYMRLLMINYYTLESMEEF